MNRYPLTLPILLFLLAIGPSAALAQPVQVAEARIWTDPDKTRLVFDTRGEVKPHIFTLEHPHRVVIDLANARLTAALPAPDPGDRTLVGLRSGVQNGQDLRIVADVRGPVRVKSFPLTPNERYGHRLMIDLIPAGPAAGRAPAAPRRAADARALVIAIDAGHGGEDPGAIGPGGTREKEVTLAIARRLARLVDAEPGMRAQLIRDGDYYIGLRQRIVKARQQRADLFISIHADAFDDPQAHGSSVYTLSNGGASSEAARWLANRENSADLIGGVELSAGDDQLATVLLDMSQSAALEHSTEVAGAILTRLGGLGALHKSEVQRAGFAVLKAPDIPSLLVETAFISNAAEERRLTDPQQQQRLAQAILAGIKVYFQKYPPRGTRLAEAAGGSGARQYIVTAGDTLSDIAARHQVSLTALRAANGLGGDSIRAGQVLAIPEPGGS